ncbi:SDR family oxidoreductase [Myxococcota bacterium]|nr:SDR family oxidoreductase [Myxococcota bacterium]
MQRRGTNDTEVLLTGATGFLGKVVLYELLRRREQLGLARVHVLLRPRGGTAVADRWREELLPSACFAELPAGWADRVAVIAGDCERPDAGIEAARRAALASSVTHVIHCAASVEFDLPIAQATAANATSALHVLELARGFPRLAALVSVSTAYVTPHPGAETPVEERLAPLPWDPDRVYDAIRAGRHDAPVAEAALLAESGHPNTYTLTKSLAEHLLARRRGALPLVLVRPSIIAASQRRPFPGWIDSAAAFALFAVGIGSGRMRVVLARPEARLDLVPVDAVAERIVEAAFRAPAVRPDAVRAEAPTPAPPILHLTSGWELSPTLRMCQQRVGPFFERHARPGAPPPRVRYLGPDGWRWRLAHRRHHGRRAAGEGWADAIAETSRRFAYFTHHSFRFVSSVPLDARDFEPGAYLETVCRGVWRHLLGGDERTVPVAGRVHARDGGRIGWALRQPHGNGFLRLASVLVDATLARSHECVSVDEASFRTALAGLPRDARRMLVPSHRSYLDFVLLSYLCFARPDLGIPIPHVAAASEFARIPLLGWLFRRLHAFYLVRGQGHEDKRLTQTVGRLVREGCVLEFFLEGQRSRSRRFLEPRRGLLRSLQATGRPCALLPIAISYDHVPEEASFLDELRGAPKPSMRLRDLLRWTGRLLRGDVELGHAHIACGRPIRLDLESDVHDLSRQLIAELQAHTVATTHHLRAFLAATAPAGVDLAWLREAIVRRGGHVLDGPPRRQPVHAVTERCLREHIAPWFLAEAALAYAGNPGIEAHVRRQSWGARGAAIDAQAELADARVRSVVRALFDPVCAAKVAGVRALLADAGASLPAPAELARRLPAAHLPDLEALYEELAEGGLLVRADRGASWSFGPRAAELLRYAAACETIGLPVEEGPR